MSIVMATAEQAREQAQSATAALRESATQFLETHDGACRLHDLLLYLRSEGAPDELISRALTGLLAEGRLQLTAQRSVVLKPA